MSIRILADKDLYKIRDLVPVEAELTLFNPAGGFPENAIEFDAMLIRTVTKISPETLPKAGRLRFIGTATAGYDHIDLNHLAALEIVFGHSPGCNARAVAEYVLTGILRWSELRNREPSTLNVGVVGCGHTGGAVMDLLQAISIPYRPYDPPKQAEDPLFKSVDLNQLLECDILTFHTPLISTGPHKTFQLCSKDWLKHPFQLIINAARGGVVDEQSLMDAMHRGIVKDCILDVWENEPVFSDQMAKTAMISTPHIAGYSREAKAAATRMVVEEMCACFGLKPGSSIDFNIADENISLPDLNDLADNSLSGFLWALNQINLYQHEFQKLIGLPDQKKADAFARLRTGTPTRFEFATLIRALREKGNQMPDGADIFLENL
jgi:erythronate-4-phosphate dehydrogenase